MCELKIVDERRFVCLLFIIYEHKILSKTKPNQTHAILRNNVKLELKSNK